PPRIPLFPSAPNRPLLFAGVLVLALGAGIATAFLLNQHNPVFYSGHRLRAVTGLPVFGTVTTTVDRGLDVRDVAFGVAASVLLATFALLLVTGAAGIRLAGA